MSTVKVRFAPSPTGHLHIGGLRTALFNWLYARHTGGQFLVRIEDTDHERSEEAFVTSILESLAWSGIEPDEPPVFQSARIKRHKEVIEQLIETGNAYRCFCPATDDSVGRDYLKYDGRCRNDAAQPDDPSRPHVVRFKTPLSLETIRFDDIIRGQIVFDRDQIDDFIIQRSDGTPVYNLVVVVDDADMGITHVIRGEDHISNTPKQILLYRALDFTVPAFAHIPLILGSDGRRLSKRDAATSVLEYKHAGYLPDALCNYLARLGWAHGDEERFTKEQMIKLFTLDAVGKSGATFDQAKLDWLNGLYMRDMNASSLAKVIIKDVQPDFIQMLSGWSEEVVYAAIDLYKSRAATLSQMAIDIQAVHDFSNKPLSEELASALPSDEARLCIKDFITCVAALDTWQVSAIKDCAKKVAKQHNVKMMHLAKPVRLAVTGLIDGPGAFELLGLLGKQESITRMQVLERV